jgi:hypothetical protein
MPSIWQVQARRSPDPLRDSQVHRFDCGANRCDGEGRTAFIASLTASGDGAPSLVDNHIIIGDIHINVGIPSEIV